MGEIKAPEAISLAHDLREFDCGEPTLNEWLKKRALKNEGKFSKTKVVSDGKKVVAFYTLAFGTVNRDDLNNKLKRNAPDQIPVMILARLAVDLEFQGQNIAKHMLKEALLKTVEASEIGGLRGLVVHALNPKAMKFYQQYGFKETPIELTLFLTIEDIIMNLD